MIIGFCGYAGAGKDEAARGLSGFTRRAFADELKREVMAFAVAHYKINPLACSPAEKELIRWLMVGHGATMRKIDPDYWVNHVEASMSRVDQGPMTGKTVGLLPISTNWAITDVRYANECKWIKNQGGSVVLVIRPGFRAANDEESGSIQEIITRRLITRAIDNCGTIEELHRQVREIAA